MMIHVGVDVAKADHCVAAIDERGRVVLAPTTITHDAEGFARLGRLLCGLGSPGTVVVGMEATGHYWLLLAEELTRLGWAPQVFNPILSCEAGRLSVRGRKTDEDDAIIIAKVLRDGAYNPVRMPEHRMGELKTLCRHRQLAVERSTNLKKRLIGLLDLVFPEFAKHFSEPYAATARAVLERAQSARLIAALNAKALGNRMCKASRGSLGDERAMALIAAAKTSLAKDRIDPATELAIAMTIEELALLDRHIDAYDIEIVSHNPAGKDLLMSIPGIGPVLAAIVLAEIGTIDRFVRVPGTKSDGVHRLLAFAGLDPRTRESGQWTGTVRMSKRGSRVLRTAIWRAAFVARKHVAFKDTWERQRILQKKHVKVAISHVARKMVQAIYGVLRYQKPFDLVAFRGTQAKTAA